MKRTKHIMEAIASFLSAVYIMGADDTIHTLTHACTPPPPSSDMRERKRERDVAMAYAKQSGLCVLWYCS